MGQTFIINIFDWYRRQFPLNRWHREYYWLIKYVSFVYSCSIGRTQGCGSHTRFSLWQLFYNTSTWFMGAIYFPFFVHTELHTLLLFTKYVLFMPCYATLPCKLLLRIRPSVCWGTYTVVLDKELILFYSIQVWSILVIFVMLSRK